MLIQFDITQNTMRDLFMFPAGLFLKKITVDSNLCLVAGYPFSPSMKTMILPTENQRQ